MHASRNASSAKFSDFRIKSQLVALSSHLQDRSGLVVARLPEMREVPGSNRTADKKLCACFYKKINAKRSFGHGLHT